MLKTFDNNGRISFFFKNQLSKVERIIVLDGLRFHWQPLVVAVVVFELICLFFSDGPFSFCLFVCLFVNV